MKRKIGEFGQTFFCVWMDGENVHCVLNSTPKSYENVYIYLSDPWYNSFGSLGKLSNLKILKIENL